MQICKRSSGSSPLHVRINGGINLEVPVAPDAFTQLLSRRAQDPVFDSPERRHPNTAEDKICSMPDTPLPGLRKLFRIDFEVFDVLFLGDLLGLYIDAPLFT